MDAKEIRRHIRQNPSLKQWLRANRDWLRAHPQSLHSMLQNPTFLSSFSHTLQKNSSRLQKRLKRVNTIRENHAPPTPKPKLRFPPLSTLNEKLSQTSQFIGTIQSMMKNIKK
jgi:hypothetical protein